MGSPLFMMFKNFTKFISFDYLLPCVQEMSLIHSCDNEPVT